MASSPVLPFALPEFQIEFVRTVGTKLLVEAHATISVRCCPSCQHSSRRIHSRYTRSARDLPVSEQAVSLVLHVRRFFCDNPDCPRRTFAERLPDLVPFRAQRTVRLTRTLQVLGFALSGEAGAHVATRLQMRVSGDTLLRIMRHTDTEPPATPRVLGVDDFALQKGRVYGTILVDLERHRPVDLLPDRTADTFATWLRTHPGVTLIARDRSTEYARGATEGAPTAVQVADRWHVLQNLREAVERVLNRNHAQLCQLPILVTPPLAPVAPAKPRRLRAVSASERIRQAASRARRLARYQAVRQLVAEGVSYRAIARQLRLSRTTVRLFAQAEAFPERAVRQPSATILDPYLAYLQQRWEAGCSNGAQLWREIRAQGYPGGHRQVRRWVHQQRTTPAPTTPANYRPPCDGTNSGRRPRKSRRGKKPAQEPLAAPRQLVWLFLRGSAKLTPEETTTLARLPQDPQIMRAYELAQQFQQMVRERRSAELDDWLAACAASGVADLQTFATTLRRDETAIRNALIEPWSTGQVEGQITRLKCIKRQMYGRANFDLLRQRILHAA
jgi:transposase